MCERANITIEKLKRVRIGNYTLGKIKTGEYIKLTPKDLDALFSDRQAPPQNQG